MAIGTYAELQTSVASWLHRTDLTAMVLDFITLAESRLNRVLHLRVMETEATLVTTAGSRFAPLPALYNEPRGLWRDTGGDRVPLTQKMPEDLSVTGTAGLPVNWAVDGVNAAFECPLADAGVYVLRYLQNFALSGTAPTNWLLTAYPDIYLYGALLEAAPYIKDDARLAVWQDRFDRAFSEVSDKEQRSRAPVTLAVDAGLASAGSFNINGGD